MKHLLTLFILSLTLTLSAQIDATKEETVNWLKSRLDYDKQWEETHFEQLEVVKYDYENEVLFYKVHYLKFDGTSKKGYRIDAIPMRDINPDRIQIVRMIGEDGELGIELYTNNGKKSIQSTIYGIEGFKPMSSYYDMVTLYFPKYVISTQGVNITHRVVTALKHLIKLSGGRGEKF